MTHFPYKSISVFTPLLVLMTSSLLMVIVMLPLEVACYFQIQILHVGLETSAQTRTYQLKLYFAPLHMRPDGYIYVLYAIHVNYLWGFNLFSFVCLKKIII